MPKLDSKCCGFHKFQVLKGAPTIDGRPGESMEALDFSKLKEELIMKHSESEISDKDVISAALYPKVFDDFKEFRAKYGPVDKLDTRTFFVGPDIAENITVSCLSSPRRCRYLLNTE